MGPPPALVLDTFGAGADPVPLAGGQGGAWRCGDVVLKPLDTSEQMLRWQAELLPRFEGRPDFRVAPPLHARNGSLSVAGWTAWPYLSGRHPANRWGEVVAAGEAFHLAVRDVPRPSRLDRRVDRWAIADRVAWGEIEVEQLRDDPVIARLMSHLRPVSQPCQLVHGDLSGNVLLHPSLPPAVIDISPYWRPPAFAAAVVLADALLWHDADEQLVRDHARLPDLAQLLLRALLFRLVAQPREARTGPADRDPYLRAGSLVCALAEST